MRLNTITAIAIGALSFFILVGGMSSPAQAQDSITVVSLAADLAAATTEADAAALVSAARNAGLSDLQIADAFGRASAAALDATVLSASYATFKAGSSLAGSTLDASYSAGQTTATSTGGPGNRRNAGRGNLGGTPNGGSGGGGGSDNK